MGAHPSIGPMRAILLVGGIFVVIAGIQLYPLAKHTDDYFAWTIQVPATAAFLGACYLAASIVAVGSSHRETWAEARFGVPGVLVFVWLMLVVTLLHPDAFHFDDGPATARAAAWAWLAIYALEPPLLTWIYWRQLREPGEDPDPSRPLPGWYRGALGAIVALLVAVGIALLVAPTDVASIWPWPLTALTAQAVGAWLVGIGLVVAGMWWENDWARIGLGIASLAVLAPLLGLALALYPEKLEWGTELAGYIAGVALIGAAGLAGAAAHRRALRGNQPPA